MPKVYGWKSICINTVRKLAQDMITYDLTYYDFSVFWREFKFAYNNLILETGQDVRKDFKISKPL